MAGIIWWTPPRLAAAKALVDGGATYRQVAAAISRRYRRHVTQGAVNRLCRRMRWHGKARGGRPWTP
jgi:hypothetical protein